MDPYFQNENEDGPEFLTMEDFQPLMGTSSSFLQTAIDESTTVLNNFSSQEFNEAISNDNLLARADSTSEDFYQFQQNPNNKTATGDLPATEDYPGDYFFFIKMDEIEINKNKWAYSSKLNKLYIRSEIIVPIPFQWIPIEPDLVVRALPIFSDPQHMKQPVKRCYNHSNPLDATNNGFPHVEHILRSENSGAVYEKNEQSERCSVVVPLEDLQPGCSTMSILFKFMCQTTCSGGIERRPITVLFTLERSNGEVMGRQKVNVKICSCPKRDMDKEEKNIQGNKPARTSRPLPELEPAQKRIKREVNEEGYHLQLKFSNVKLYRSSLKRIQEYLFRKSRTDRDDPIAVEAAKLLPEIDNQLCNLCK